MCTIVDKKATKEYRNKLKKTGGKGHAWKLVRVVDKDFVSPFQEKTVYSRTRPNKISHNTPFRRYDWGLSINSSSLGTIITDGVFHCCMTRKVARLIQKFGINLRDCKIVKVIFDMTDIVTVGKNHPDDVRIWNLDPKQNEVVCVTKFRFMEK